VTPVSLSDLTPAQRQLVLALIRAGEEATKKGPGESALPGPDRPADLLAGRNPSYIAEDLRRDPPIPKAA